MLMDVVCLDNTLIRSADIVIITNDGSSDPAYSICFLWRSHGSCLSTIHTLQYIIGPLAVHCALLKEYSIEYLGDVWAVK